MSLVHQGQLSLPELLSGDKAALGKVGMPNGGYKNCGHL